MRSLSNLGASTIGTGAVSATARVARPLACLDLAVLLIQSRASNEDSCPGPIITGAGPLGKISIGRHSRGLRISGIAGSIIGVEPSREVYYAAGSVRRDCEDVVPAGFRVPCVEDRPGFLVPGWSRSDGLGAAPVCLSPWRRAGVDVAELIVSAGRVGPDDVFVDLGSGDGSVVLDVVGRTGCVGVGIEAASDLVALSARSASRLSAGRAVFLHELIGSRGLSGATVLYTWLLASAAGVVQALVDDVLTSGSLRTLIVVGPLGPELDVGPSEVVGRVRTVAERASSSYSSQGRSVRFGSESTASPRGGEVDLGDVGVSPEPASGVAVIEDSDWYDVYRVSFDGRR